MAAAGTGYFDFGGCSWPWRGGGGGRGPRAQGPRYQKHHKHHMFIRALLFCNSMPLVPLCTLVGGPAAVAPKWMFLMWWLCLAMAGRKGGARAQGPRPGGQKCHRHHKPMGRRCFAIGAPIRIIVALVGGPAALAPKADTLTLVVVLGPGGKGGGRRRRWRRKGDSTVLARGNMSLLLGFV